jgi:hypothetical protein
MSDYYQCEATSTTKDKTLAIESNLPMATMFIYIFIFFAICLIVFIFYRENSNITNVNTTSIGFNSVANNFIYLFNYVINLLNANTHRKLLVLLLLFILFGIFITAIVNVSA